MAMQETKEQVSKWKDIEAKLIAKAIEDTDFRKALLDDPKAAIEKEFNSSVPEGLSIKVVEEEPNTLTLMLPQQIAGEGDTLSDEQLEAVSGGGLGCNIVSSGFVGVI